MATFNTTIMASSPPVREPSTSNLSSPLSEVDDRDADPEESQPKTPTRHARTSELKEVGRERGHDLPGPTADDDSNLSDVNTNNSEAETERLYDTPRKATPLKIVSANNSARSLRLQDRGDRAADQTPSKLARRVRVSADGAVNSQDNNNNSPSGLDNDDEVHPESKGQDCSSTLTDIELCVSKPPKLRSKTPDNKVQPLSSGNDAVEEEQTINGTPDQGRKRKRSLSAAPSATEQPSRKRTGSIGPPDRNAGSLVNGDDTKSQKARPSPDLSKEDKTNNENEASSQPKGGTPTDGEATVPEPGKTRRSQRTVAKSRKSKSPDEVGPEGQAHKDTRENARRQADQGHIAVDVEEEADAIQKNDDEEERKKAAWQELAAIEKQFTNFRERLYQERLDQLNREEAMLKGDNPDHPEYLAMLTALDKRREEKSKIIQAEYRLNTDLLKRRAAAERAQIMSQFCQSVRESREKVLEKLGREWYRVKHERRRHANVIPNYSIRYPATRNQAVRHTVQYIKEVSVLSGVAKHVGFPAAPIIQGASMDEMEDDLEAIQCARQEVSQSIPASVFRQDQYSSSFGQTMERAGEMSVEQTPWTNPNHPSHQIPKPPPQSEHTVTTTTAGPTVPRIHPQQATAQLLASAAAAAAAGSLSPIPKAKSVASAGHENSKASKTIGHKHQGVAQAS